MSTLSDWSKVFQHVRLILEDPAGFIRGKPVFKTIQQLDVFLTRYGGRLISNTAYGPRDPEARQIIWKIGDYILIKVKTKGYRDGPRAGRPTMSITITDGRDHAWVNETYKITGHGIPVDPNVIAHNQAVAGRRPTSPHEVVHLPPGARIQHQIGLPDQERRQRRWADATHLDLEPGFNSSGAKDIGRMVTAARVRVLGKGLAGALLTLLTTVILERPLTVIQQNDLLRQWDALQPEIDIELQKYSPTVVAYLREGKRPYANITFNIFSMTVFTPSPSGPDIRTETAPKMRFEYVRVSDNNLDIEEPIRREASTKTIVNIKRFTVSFELGI